MTELNPMMEHNPKYVLFAPQICFKLGHRNLTSKILGFKEAYSITAGIHAV